MEAFNHKLIRERNGKNLLLVQKGNFQAANPDYCFKGEYVVVRYITTQFKSAKTIYIPYKDFQQKLSQQCKFPPEIP